MRVAVGETIWHVHVHHEDLDDTDLPRRKRKSWDVVTYVAVHTGPCVPATGTQKYCINGALGKARCSKKDNFVKVVGFKDAMREAMRTLGRDVRTAIWKAVWANMRRPREKRESFRRRRLEVKAA